MALTSAQASTLLATVKADTDPAVIAAYASKQMDVLANLYNAAANPQVLVWRKSIRPAELNTAIVWSEYSTLTVALQNCYLAMVSGISNIDATNANIRGGFSTIFSGKVSLTNLTTLAQRAATKFENLFVTSQLVDPTLDGYTLTPQDLGAVLFNADGSPK
jgi:hypothetical protein